MLKNHLVILPLVSILLFGNVSTDANANELDMLYKVETEFTYEDLVVDVHGYPVPTLTAFRGWMLLNNAEKTVLEIAQRFEEGGVVRRDDTMPLHLVLLQGTEWSIRSTSVFTLPSDKNVENMIRTIKFIQQHVEPVIGVVIPLSGERNDFYNSVAGGAPKSQHLNFCALDLVPVKAWSRTELHQKLNQIWNSVGQANNVGLGLYSGIRFHIDTCGFRRW